MTSAKVKVTKDDQGRKGFRVRVDSPTPSTSVSSLNFFFHDFTLPAKIATAVSANAEGQSLLNEVWVRELSEEERAASETGWPYRVEIRDLVSGEVTPRADHYSRALAFVTGQLLILSDSMVEYFQGAVGEIAEAFEDDGSERLQALTNLGQQVIGILGLTRRSLREDLLETLDTFPEGKIAADAHRARIRRAQMADIAETILRGMRSVEDAVGSIDKGKMPA